MKPNAPQQATPQGTAPDDPDLEARIERALAPYKDLVPPEDLAFMREMMALYINSHPDAATLVDRLRNRAPVDASTQVTRPGARRPTAESTEVPRVRGGGRAPTTTPRRKGKPGGR